MSRLNGWTKLRRSELYAQWTAQFSQQESALAHAVWVANRLVKAKTRTSRSEFYSLKDAWLERNQVHLISGHIAREEVKYCFACEGTGECNCGDGMWYDRTCNRCYGSAKCRRCNNGIYESWLLYEHRLEIDGQRYSFHSYERPHKLSDQESEDCPVYGGSFTEEELAALPLPYSGVMEVLRFAAVHRWGMRRRFDDYHWNWKWEMRTS